MTTPTIKTDTIRALCARIQAAAIKCEDYHVFVDWQAHTGSLTVCVRDVRTDYNAPCSEWPEPLLNEYTYLVNAGWCDPVHELTAIIDRLQLLGVDV